MSLSYFREWRLREGFTQAQSAAALGYSLRRIKFYDKGEKTPNRALRLAMRAISEGLTIDEDDRSDSAAA